MNLQALLTLGERIDLSIDGTSYRSVVQDVESKNELLVAQVTKGMLPLYIPVGKRLQMVFFRQNGVYYFPAEMAGIVIDGPLKMLRFLALEEPVRWQRRANFRLQMALPVRAWYDVGNLDATVRSEIVCRTFDLSSTGAMLVCPHSFESGQIIFIDLSLDAETMLSIQCEVRRVTGPEDDGNFYAAVMFQNLSPRLLRYLSRYLMDEQIKLQC